MEKKIFNVTFHWSGSTYCSNVVIAQDAEQVASHYSEYDCVYIEEGREYDVKDAERRGKPIIRL